MQTRLRQGRVDELDRYITAAQGAAQRAAALTHRLLAFSRRQTLDPKPTDVNRLIAGMEDLIRRTVGPGHRDRGRRRRRPVADAGRSEPARERAAQPLHQRARRDAGRRPAHHRDAPTNGSTSARARERELPPGQYVSLCVTDTGTGMTPEVIERAFDPFFTTKPLGQGTGLGLSMIYGFARQSGGQVRIYSEAGQGHDHVPLSAAPSWPTTEDDDEPHDGTATSHVGDGETVLVVDDEPTVRMLITEVLEELGYTAIEAADGAPA